MNTSYLFLIPEQKPMIVNRLYVVWAVLWLTMFIWTPTWAADGEGTPELSSTSIPSTFDGEQQPLRFWAPDSSATQPTPLLVSLHTWSGDYRQDHAEWLREAAARGWIFLQPNFRGPNDDPLACGSPAARQDILDAIDWACRTWQVDENRVYLAGASGGGHMSLLMAARHPDRFSAVSAWVGISDLREWHDFHSPDGQPDNYAQMIAASCGGAPGDSEEVDRQYQDRSPIFFLQHAVGLPLDICAGVRDGKDGSVPIAHSLRAYNVIARAEGADAIPDTVIEELWERGRLTAPLPGDEADDPTYGRSIHLRRTAGQARVTIFDGAHEALPRAACEWLSRQSRSTHKGK